MIIIEGIVGTGKTELYNALKANGMHDIQYNRDQNETEFYKKYTSIDLSSTDNAVKSQSFISEMAKGEIVHGQCRLTMEQYENLLRYHSTFGAFVVYLKADKETLLTRRLRDTQNYPLIGMKYEFINDQYDMVMDVASRHLRVMEIDTTKTSTQEIIDQINKFYHPTQKDRHMWTL